VKNNIWIVEMVGAMDVTNPFIVHRMGFIPLSGFKLYLLIFLEFCNKGWKFSQLCATMRLSIP
jgi:hypothetical protein